MATNTVVEVPNVLNSDPHAVEEFIRVTDTLRPGDHITLRCSAITWVCPYGALSLFGVCRYLTQLSGHPVSIAGLQDNVHAYLRRIDFFERALPFVEVLDSFDSHHELARSDSSSNVLELVSIATPGDIFAVSRRARGILGYWLDGPRGQHDTDRVVSLIAESCSNVVDHSHDFGVVTIQKYERQDCVDVELAISDLGQGIRRSLCAVHGQVSDTCSGFISQAIAGLSARSGGRGGQGLGAIERIATSSGGSLYIRSETGSILSTTGKILSRDELTFFPGTQIAICFRSEY